LEACGGNIDYVPPQFPVLPCPTAAEVDQIRNEIPLTIKSDTSAGMLQCREADGSADLTPAQFEIYRALLFLRQLRFDAPLPWAADTVWDWLRRATPKGIEIDSVGNSHSCLNCPVTIVWPPTVDWSAQDRSITGMPWDTIVHEARHAEGYLHTCNYVAGRNVSDRTIAEMGADGVAYYLLQWIGNHSNEEPTFRAWARTRATLQRMGSIFCCECVGIQPGATAQP
jgi:hypothetical protein